MVTGAKAGKQCEPPRSLAFASLDSAVPATGSTEKFYRASANYRSKKDPEGCAIPEREDLSLWTMKRGGPIRQDSRLYASPYSLCWTRRPPFKPPNNSQRAKCRPSSARSRHWGGVARACSRRTSTRSNWASERRFRFGAHIDSALQEKNKPRRPHSTLNLPPLQCPKENTNSPCRACGARRSGEKREGSWKLGKGGGGAGEDKSLGGGGVL